MYRQHGNGAGAEQQYHVSASPGMSAFGQPTYATAVYGIDPSISPAPHQQNQQHLHARSSSDTFVASMQPPSPGRGQTSNFKPTDRVLPSRDVTAETLTNSFADFILYCCPNFPLGTDTSTLKSNFENPPKSDGKDFNTWHLFQLIRKLECKEIKTWNQLALDLGVEAPNVQKGQSTQKVQQFTVRLKRWMRAMHIDAFFEYLLGKHHVYFTELPLPDDPYPTNGRDGVMAEDDLAIRALDPSFRPKRGRRRNSENEASDQGIQDSTAKQQQRLPERTDPYSAVAYSAHPDGHHDPWAVASAVTPQSFAPWSGRPPASAMSTTAPSNLRWQLGRSQTPSTPHPMSAVPNSMSAHIDAAFDGEPKSAITPSSRKRRKHGPAVSSAWPSSQTPGAKPRGRPPASRNAQDGPFSSFPVDPNNTKMKSQVPTSTAAVEGRPSSSGQSSPRTVAMDFQSQAEGRPGRLSLQVPPHTGAPVRLATPPALQVNGEARELETRSDSDDPSRALPAQGAPGMQVATQRLAQGATDDSRSIPSFTFEALKRVLTSDLLRADVHGRRQRLSGEEAKRLADSMLDRLHVPRTGVASKDDVARLNAATWLGVGDHGDVPFHSTAGHGKRISVTRFRADNEGYEEIVKDDSMTNDTREVFDVQWHTSMGGCVGSFEMKGLSLATGPAAASHEVTGESTHDMMLRKGIEAIYKLDKRGWVEDSMREIAQSAAQQYRPSEDNIDWKARCKAMEFASNVARGEVQRARARMLEQVINAVL